LKLSPCSSGLRLGIVRLFGPFCRDFLVPWDEISVVRKDRFFVSVPRWPMAGNDFFWNSMRGRRSSRASAYGDA
jgi:hypothetical protein